MALRVHTMAESAAAAVTARVQARCRSCAAPPCRDAVTSVRLRGSDVARAPGSPGLS